MFWTDAWAINIEMLRWITSGDTANVGLLESITAAYTPPKLFFEESYR